MTAIHLLGRAAGRPRWASISWFLCITHLGLLGERSKLGWSNRLTLLRALLPVFMPNCRRSVLVALATDFADGRLARNGEETAFGAFADPIADGVFWSWFALRWEPHRWLRRLPITLFATSLGAFTVAYFATGRAIDYPRPLALRYISGFMQVVFTVRALGRSSR